MLKEFNDKRKRNFAERLRETMKEQNLRQVDVLQKCKYISEIKISKSNLSQWLSGYSTPSLQKLFVLSEALNVDLLWLAGFDNERRGKNDRQLHSIKK